MIVGVNRFQGDDPRVPVVKVSPQHEREQQVALAELRATRDQGQVDRLLAAVKATARGRDNLLGPIREALRAYATIGEVCTVLREVFGEYRPVSTP